MPQMLHASPSRRTGRALATATGLVMILLLTPACAARPKQAEAAVPMRQLPAPEAVSAQPGATSSTTDELRGLMEAQQLTELRTTYNGKYGASLLFHTESLNYYVALFHDRSFWRVIRTDSFEEAEQLYGTFVEQTRELAQVHIDAIRLDAGKQYTERMVALNSQQLETLQAEIAQQREQSMQVQAAMQQARQQAVSLSGDLRATNSQLEAINQRIRDLQAQQSNPEMLLPPPQQQQPQPAAPTDAVATQPGADAPAE